MSKKNIFEVLQSITEPVVQSFGLKLWGIDVLQSGRPIVRIFVDVQKNEHDEQLEQNQSDDMQAHSATVDQCAKISRLVGIALEVEDIFSSAYVLEVSSPGLTRPFFELEQMTDFIGDNIEIVLADFLPQTEQLPQFATGRKKFSGKLLSTSDNSICLNVEHADQFHPMDFMWESIRKAVRVHVFTKPEKPGKKRKDA